MNVGMPSGDVDALGPWLGVLHLVVAGLLVPLVLAWAQDRRRRVLIGSALGTVLAAAVIYVKALQPRDIPIDWITVLHESMERKTIMHLYTRGVHAGTNFAFIVSKIARGGVPTLHDVVWLNLLLAVVNAVIFFHIALRIVSPVWALVWTAVMALNPATFLASFSELPTNLLTLYFFCALLAWDVLHDPSQKRVLRVFAVACCAALTIAVALTRFEVALVGLTALGLEALYRAVGPERWRASGERLATVGQRLLEFLSDHPIAVVLLCALGVQFSLAGLNILPFRFSGREATSALYPFNPSILSLFVYLPMLGLPIAVSVAVLFGWIHALRHFRRFGGLALSLFLLVRAYFAGESQYFEMGRYISYILPAMLFLALFGGRELEHVTRRRCTPTWRRATHVVYLMAWFTLPLPGLYEFYVRPGFDRHGGLAELLPDRNTQREVRYLMTLMERNPQCVFVGRVVQDEHGDPKVRTEYSYAVFGAPISQPVIVPEKTMAVSEVIAKYAGNAVCVRLYFGGDCNLTFTDHCGAFIEGRRRVDEERFWSRPYNNFMQNGYGAPEIVLATYAWP